MVMEVIPVLLSGGVGSRLWPLSRSTAPKQLQALLGDRTMIQATVERLEGISADLDPVVVCNRIHADIVDRQLAEIGWSPRLIIAEPVGRNTAPAVAAAAYSVPEEAVMVVLPADHVVTDRAAFRAAVGTAVEAARQGFLVTFGVRPHRPETGYGYIRLGDRLGKWWKVDGFVEKPDHETARRYVADGGHLWNSGMFVFTAATVRSELEKHAPEVVEAVSVALGESHREGRVATLGADFVRSPAISIDYAVMERTDRAVVVPLDAGWSDVGSWATLWEIEERDADDNVVRGDAEVLDVHRSYVRSEGRLVAVVGLDDVVVVDTGDAVLVAARDRVQDVKRVVERLAARGRPEVE